MFYLTATSITVSHIATWTCSQHSYMVTDAAIQLALFTQGLGSHSLISTMQFSLSCAFTHRIIYHIKFHCSHKDQDCSRESNVNCTCSWVVSTKSISKLHYIFHKDQDCSCSHQFQLQLYNQQSDHSLNQYKFHYSHRVQDDYSNISIIAITFSYIAIYIWIAMQSMKFLFRSIQVPVFANSYIQLFLVQLASYTLVTCGEH